jgi:Fic family protein
LNREDFGAQKTGRLMRTLRGCWAFVPEPLPPKNLDLGRLVQSIALANRRLGELSGVGRTLQNPYLLIRPFMRREAVASSRIEGTVTTLSQLLLFEVDEGATPPSSDAREVLNYVRALEHAVARLDQLPVSLRLIREMHRILLDGVAPHRGAAVLPGEFKKDQNWIGSRLIENARFVPPPPREAQEAMERLEVYIHDLDRRLPTLVDLALIHYQFEAIHPFADGNGRVGRLLIPLILLERGEISQPLLYLSDYFERNYDGYIDRMLDISQHGKWEEWIEFFLVGVEETCRDALAKAQALQDIQARYRELVQKARTSALLGRLVDMLLEHPAVTIPHASARLGIAYNAAKNNIGRLVDLGILTPDAFGSRPKVFVASEIMSALTS